MSQRFLRSIPPIFIVAALAAAPQVTARGWGKIPKAERALKSVDWYPQADAVVLLHRTSVEISDRREDPSRRKELRRIKILTEAGKEHGTVSILSSEYSRLKHLDARIVLPNGKEIPLPKDAVFEKKYSEYYDAQVTSIVMPEVAVGAIVEWRYSIYFNNPLRHWEVPFQNELPTLQRQVVLLKPDQYEFQASFVDPANRRPKTEVKQLGKFSEVTYTMVNLAPLPDEPYRPPYVDLASRVHFVPGAVSYKYQGVMEVGRTWNSLVELLQEDHYKLSRKQAGKARRVGKEMTTDLESDREKVRALHRFVSGEIVEQFPGSLVATHSLDAVLSDRKGTMAEKALLLQVMLEGAGIPASLGWTNPRQLGKLSPKLPNLSRVNKILVSPEIDGTRLFLDPTRPSEHLQPELEDIRCLLVDEDPPRWVGIPQTSSKKTGRTASIDAEVDSEGRITATGRLELTGHQAGRYLGWRDTSQATETAWVDWLSRRFDGFDVSVAEVAEDVSERSVRIEWAMRQRDEDVLGDEVSIDISAPLGLGVNPFTLAPDDRSLPVHLPFREFGEVRLRIRWPEGWKVDLEPDLRTTVTSVGELRASIEVDSPQRNATVRRRLEIWKRRVDMGKPYTDLQRLYRSCVESDAETLVLVREP